MVAEHRFVPMYTLSNRALTTKRSRHLCVADAHPIGTLLSIYAQPATASEPLFMLSAKRLDCQFCNRAEPSDGGARVVTMVKGRQSNRRFALGQYVLRNFRLVQKREFT